MHVCSGRRSSDVLLPFCSGISSKTNDRIHGIYNLHDDRQVADEFGGECVFVAGHSHLQSIVSLSPLSSVVACAKRETVIL